MRILLTLGLGALAMYLLDPQQGRRRRAPLQDQLSHARTALRGRSATRTDPDGASATPQGAQHLGR